ncbi:hypothetical protein niasHS_010324 [Heterodera schachtii]|uniref:BTB domain-containing protein n=1 Tax=Heterodera schachtii TaxID=97005 RepID=A0ABD2J4J3_HETSC
MSSDAATLADRIKLLLTTAAADDADVHFLVGKGEEKELLSAHKLILKTASDVFQAMFRFDAANAKEGYAMLKFIYTDELDALSGDNLFEVLYAAKKYNVSALIKACTEFPLSKLNNVFETLLKARFIEEHLQTNGEICIWKAALRWADAQCRRNGIDCSAENRRKLLGSALFRIRFPLVPKAEFAESVVPSDLLTKEELISVLLYHCRPPPGLHYTVQPVQYPLRFNANARTKPTDEAEEEQQHNQQQSFAKEMLSSIRCLYNDIYSAVTKVLSKRLWLFKYFLALFFLGLICFMPILFSPYSSFLQVIALSFFSSSFAVLLAFLVGTIICLNDPSGSARLLGLE